MPLSQSFVGGKMASSSTSASGSTSATATASASAAASAGLNREEVDPFDELSSQEADQGLEGSTPIDDNATELDPLDTIKKRQRANIWEHFERYKTPSGQIRARCKYCVDRNYAADSAKNGTRGLITHLQKCLKYPPNMVAKKNQKVLSVEKPTEMAVGFNQKDITSSFVEMVIVDELPFSFGDGKGFRNFMSKASPRWKVPCRQVVARDVLSMYYTERQNLKELMKSYRICITTDTWTSLQNINYMVVTAHFIDVDWVLHKKIINFCVIPNHKGDTIGRLLEECMCEWGIEKLLTVTVDNASANDSGLSYLLRRMNAWKSPMAILNNGSNMHVRCIAHILNLIVNDGLHELNSCIQSIRNAVRYVRSSPSRLEMLKKCAEKVKVDNKGLVVLDVPTRWNSTYLMLETALKFRRAFERLVDDDPSYVAHFHSDKRVGPPGDYDWEVAKVFADFLKPFYEITLRVCCSKTPTIHSAFQDVFQTYGLLHDETSMLLSGIVCSMQAKYDKYWGELENLNQYYFIALILDPRHKLERVEDFLELLFENAKGKVADIITQVKQLLTSLYSIYEGESGNGTRSSGVGGGSSSSTSIVTERTVSSTMDKKFEERLKMRKAVKIGRISNDIDRYLLDPIEDVEDSKFDILAWWKLIGVPKYPILSLLARDILAIPVSTIASESCFSTSGRVINSYRSSLSPQVVEALICTQNWLLSVNVALHLEPTIEEVEHYQAIAQEMSTGGAMLPPKSNP